MGHTDTILAPVICDTAKAAASQVAQRVIDQIQANPASVLGLATGGTMEPVYAKLCAAHAQGLSFAQVRSFNLDEYLGLPRTHPQTYRSTMGRLLFDHVDIDLNNTHVPMGDARDIDAECARYERAIVAAGGIDLQLLGIGENGHIGFNEPGSELTSRSRVVTLASQTLAANARYFPNEATPTQAATVGIATILDAKRIVVLATGTRKAQAVKAAISGAVTPHCPASFLRQHSHVDWVIDTDSAAQIRL